MAKDHGPGTPAARLGFLIYGIARGAAVAVLALALYVALTNWGGGGSVWAFVYAGIAVAIFILGLAARLLLSGR